MQILVDDNNLEQSDRFEVHKGDPDSTCCIQLAIGSIATLLQNMVRRMTSVGAEHLAVFLFPRVEITRIALPP
jgi:hypothetical protein